MVVPLPEALDTGINFWDRKLGYDNERLAPTNDLKEDMICPLTHQVTKLSISFIEEEEHELFDQLIRNIDLFC